MGKSPRGTPDKRGRSKAGQHTAVLFTCIGRRVSLLRCFQRAARQLKLDVCFCGTDTSSLSPALQLCDKAFHLRLRQCCLAVDDLRDRGMKQPVNFLQPEET